MDNMIGTLPVLKKEYELLPTTGVAEKIYTEKLREKPYTWMGNVFSIALKRLGDIPIGVEIRQDYIKSKSVTIHPAVRSIPMADANTLLVEIHRTVWENLLRKQEVLCTYCGHKMIGDIDLNRIQMSDENLQLMQDHEKFENIFVDLKRPIAFVSPRNKETIAFPEHDGQEFNRLIFSIPNLGNAIDNEKMYSDTIAFWRKVAFDCLIGIQQVAKDGTSVILEFPTSIKAAYGIKLFDEILDGRDLRNIREELRSSLPTLPFYYLDTCTNCKRETPFTLEAASFFSE